MPQPHGSDSGQLPVSDASCIDFFRFLHFNWPQEEPECQCDFSTKDNRCEPKVIFDFSVRMRQDTNHETDRASVCRLFILLTISPLHIDNLHSHSTDSQPELWLPFIWRSSLCILCLFVCFSHTFPIVCRCACCSLYRSVLASVLNAKLVPGAIVCGWTPLFSGEIIIKWIESYFQFGAERSVAESRMQAYAGTLGVCAQCPSPAQPTMYSFSVCQFKYWIIRVRLTHTLDQHQVGRCGSVRNGNFIEIV